MGNERTLRGGVAAALALGLCVTGANGQGLGGFQGGGLVQGNGSSLTPQETPWKPVKKKNKKGKFKGGGASSTGGSYAGSANSNSNQNSWKNWKGPKTKTFKQIKPRSLYVWDNTIPGDVNATDELVDFCEDRGVVNVFIESSPVAYLNAGAVANYNSFILELNSEGIEVYALNGYSWFTVDPAAGLPGQPTGWTEGWTVYSNIATSGLGFKGIVDDSAPYGVQYTSGGQTIDHFWTNTQTSAQDYLDYLRGVKAAIGTLEFVHTIPFWYDIDPSLQLKLDGSTTAQPLNVYVQGIVDTVNVLDYRDTAFGQLGMINLAAGELKLGPTMIGVETQDLGPKLTQSTFFEESLTVMEDELYSTWTAYRKHANFRGITIHHYGSYKDKK